MLEKVFILQLVTVTLVVGLENADNFREGSCSKFPIVPIRADRDFVDFLRYMTAGSRFNVYRGASSLPNYDSMTEEELKSEACYVRNTTTTQQDSIGAVFGFGGRTLATFRVRSRPGVYEETFPTNPLIQGGLKGFVTLTDHKSFAFIVVCWSAEADEAAWTVVTRIPNINLNTRRVIEEHVVSLGFKRENVVYLNYDKCHRTNPIVDNYVGLVGFNERLGFGSHRRL